MGIDNIRTIKQSAGEPKVKKVYTIPKVSEKKKKQEFAQKLQAEADKAFYLEIWNASPHKCQCGCKVGLGKVPFTTMFHHLLFKAQYPAFRHTPENIMLLHPDCHNAYHSYSDSRPEVKRRQLEAMKILL